MNEQERELAIRRILVALDASAHSLAALEAAAALAASMEAEVLGLFVEDINLLQLAGLPFVRVVNFSSTTGRPIDSPSMEQELRLQAARAQRALATIAEHRRIRWSFRVVRGEVTTEVLTAALEADLLILGKLSHPLTRRSRLGSTARAVLVHAPRPVLLLQQGASIGQPVLVVYDGSSGAKQALAVATRLVQTISGKLIVLLLAETAENAQTLEGEVTEKLQRDRIQVRCHRIEPADLQKLIQVVHLERGGLLVLYRETPFWQEEDMQKLLAELQCPILVV